MPVNPGMTKFRILLVGVSCLWQLFVIGLQSVAQGAIEIRHSPCAFEFRLVLFTSNAIDLPWEALLGFNRVRLSRAPLIAHPRLLDRCAGASVEQGVGSGKCRTPTSKICSEAVRYGVQDISLPPLPSPCIEHGVGRDCSGQGGAVEGRQGTLAKRRREGVAAASGLRGSAEGFGRTLAVVGPWGQALRSVGPH